MGITNSQHKKSKNSTQEHNDRKLFNEISYGYIQKDIIPSHSSARKLRLEQTIKVINMSTDIRILEVGCGAGFSVNYLQGNYREYFGVDYSEKLINYAKKIHIRKNVNFKAIDIKDYSPHHRFDLILLVGVLHHFSNIHELFKNMVHLLKPGGWILANEPQGGNPIIHLSRKIRKKIDSAYSSDQKEFTSQELFKIYENAGLIRINVIPQGIFSTPFAEVIMPFQKIIKPLSLLACSTDRWIERKYSHFLHNISWNLIVTGKKPDYKLI